MAHQKSSIVYKFANDTTFLVMLTATSIQSSEWGSNDTAMAVAYWLSLLCRLFFFVQHD